MSPEPAKAPAGDLAPALEVAVRRRMGSAVIDVAFRSEGRVTALFGPSGAGKTSVIHMIAGLLRPDSGRVALHGAALFDAEQRLDVPAHRRRVGVVFQDGRLFPHLTVAQNLAFGRWMNRLPRDPAEEERVVALLGLAPLLKRRPKTLSGGEKQRVAIGRALLARPRLLLLDEPLASLDAPRRAEILPYLERLRDDARTPMVYVSHAADEVRRLADTVVMLEAGRVSGVHEVAAR